jgi:hypothetical protein
VEESIHHGERESERFGHATLGEKKKCGASAPGAKEKALDEP